MTISHRDAPWAQAEVEGQSPAERVLRALQEERLSEKGRAVVELRKRLAEHPPSPHDLSDQQWYNVCKFYPNVAARAGRARFEISDAHPLDRTASAGSFLQNALQHARIPIR
jgi:hypothetical protein